MLKCDYPDMRTLRSRPTLHVARGSSCTKQHFTILSISHLVPPFAVSLYNVFDNRSFPQTKFVLIFRFVGCVHVAMFSSLPPSGQNPPCEVMDNNRMIERFSIDRIQLFRQWLSKKSVKAYATMPKDSLGNTQ